MKKVWKFYLLSMEFNFDTLQGKVAIVTGCNRGIGKAILEKFVNHGATVYAVARTEGSLSEYENSELVHPCYFDITNRDSIKNLIVSIKKEQGHIDVLVNNAGVMQDALIGMITEQQMKETFAVNVFAPMFLIQYVSKLMLRQRSGSIINIASVMGIYGNYAQMVYSASKGAVIAMTKAAAKELTPSGIRVNAVAPGVISTDLIKDVSPEKMEVFHSRIAAGRLGNPEDVANLVLFLASDVSSYISGQIHIIDGMMIN